MRKHAAAIGAVLALVFGTTPGVLGSNPSSGTLSFAHPALTWTNSVPMFGTAPALRRLTCNLVINCDDFSLTLDRGTNTQSVADFKLTVSPGSSMQIVYYPPGCDVTPTNTCYQAGGSDVRLIGPVNGHYTIRVTCTTCINASYTIAATLTQSSAAHLAAAGAASLTWSGASLPATGNTAFGEPSISINTLGHVIVNTFGPTVWISHDNGKTFTGPTVVDPTCNAVSGDADALVAFDDTYYVDNLCTAGPTNLSFSSSDGGKTWNSSKANLPTPAGTDSDRPWYGTDPKNPGVVYLSYHDFEGPNIWVLKSTDRGNTFPQAIPITLVPPASNYLDTGLANTTSRPIVDPVDPNTVTVLYAGNTAVVSATASPLNQDFDLNQFYMAQSHDGGITWTSTKLLDAGQTGGQDNTVAHEFPQATIDSAGNIYLVYSYRLGGHTQTHIEMGLIKHGTTTLEGPWQVDQGGLGANVFPWAAAGDPGMVDITWYGSTANDNNDTSAQWSEMFAQTLDALAASPHFAQSRVSGNQPIHSADICLAGTLCLATGGNRNLADFQGVDVDRCGYAEAVWTDDHTGAGLTMLARQSSGRNIRPSVCPQSGPSVAQKGSEKTTSRVLASHQKRGKTLPGTGVGYGLFGLVLIGASALIWALTRSRDRVR